MFLHGFQLCLWLLRGVEGITYPVIHSSSVHGKHDGAIFESVHYTIQKLVSACNLFSPYLQINLSVTTTL